MQSFRALPNGPPIALCLWQGISNKRFNHLSTRELKLVFRTVGESMPDRGVAGALHLLQSIWDASPLPLSIDSETTSILPDLVGLDTEIDTEIAKELLPRLSIDNPETIRLYKRLAETIPRLLQDSRVPLGPVWEHFSSGEKVGLAKAFNPGPEVSPEGLAFLKLVATDKDPKVRLEVGGIDNRHARRLPPRYSIEEPKPTKNPGLVEFVLGLMNDPDPLVRATMREALFLRLTDFRLPVRTEHELAPILEGFFDEDRQVRAASTKFFNGTMLSLHPKDVLPVLQGTVGNSILQRAARAAAALDNSLRDDWLPSSLWVLAKAVQMGDLSSPDALALFAAMDGSSEEGRKYLLQHGALPSPAAAACRRDLGEVATPVSNPSGAE